MITPKTLRDNPDHLTWSDLEIEGIKPDDLYNISRDAVERLTRGRDVSREDKDDIAHDVLLGLVSRLDPQSPQDYVIPRRTTITPRATVVKWIYARGRKITGAYIARRVRDRDRHVRIDEFLENFWQMEARWEVEAEIEERDE
jgi:hypothetical protein